MTNRNARKAAPASAAKGTASRKRRVSVSSTSTFDLSSNDNYSGVDDISDDEDDNEDDVFAVEEQAIMGEASPASTPRPHTSFNGWVHNASDQDDSSNDDDDGDDADDDDDNEDDDENGSIAAHEPTDEDEDDNASWQGIKSDSADLNAEELFNVDVEIPTQRRVRFNVPTDESSDESTEDDHASMFPDIFVDQSTLDPSFRRQIENEYDESSASDSFWDHTALYNDGLDDESDTEKVYSGLHTPFTEDQTPVVSSTTLDPTFGDMDNIDLDGYETDGESTEDEDVPHPPICRKVSYSSSVSDNEESASETEESVRHRTDQPRVSRFSLDKLKKKPMAVYNTKTGKMMIFTPDRQQRLDLSPEQFRLDSFSGLQPWPMDEQMSPIVGNNTNLMFASFAPSMMLNPNMDMDGFDGLFGGLDTGTSAIDHSSPSLENESARESDRDPEVSLRVSDFLDLDNGSSSEDEVDDSSPVKPTNPSSTPMRPTTASSDAADVLGHLNPAVVGAFRRNQTNSQLIRNGATQDSLDFSGPFNSTAIRGIRSDRFDTAAVPLTPVRRHKKQLSDLGRSPLDSLSAKRKAPSDAATAATGHKKQKSISDVGALQL
ncbi:hypothetical protein GMORB2_7247 [Geosmithia morbida]|uniref:Uncharacterized protein n=1 Tax=Geosmithia morbida TaxID=1094350 RepID=A0A9P5D3Y1_9HYPO|nr:uncharacterized protein GMORB2_7247 [Geosmithia morbida]KAF4122255.1 hypothetical protein GMORB2_7247 [Geosmithia morbida]